MSGEFQVVGTNAAAPFTLKVHRGDGMALLAMNWRKGKPPATFVGFGIEYKEPGGAQFFALKNRLAFSEVDERADPNQRSTLRAPIQKFRWVHFPRNANLDGAFRYRVTPIFMNDQDELSHGEAQTVDIELRRETYPGKLNVAFTRGFVSSQAFVDRYKTVSKLLPASADSGIGFTPTHPRAKEALGWMGFEAREAILDALDQALADKKAEVRVVAYDLNEPEVIDRLKKLGSRLRVIIDNSGSHGKKGSAENQAEGILAKSAGADNVKRQHMGGLQHNKTIAVDGPKVRIAVCGSTNFSWRALFVQANNALVVKGRKAVKAFGDAFDHYWNNSDDVAAFAASGSAEFTALGLTGIDAQVAFSPHSKSNALLQAVADDIAKKTTSCLFYSLAFLSQTPGAIRNAITKISRDKRFFVYGMADREVKGGLDLRTPDGNVSPVFPAALSKNLPEPFKSEPTGGSGVRMHHKFVVIDFDKPTARVYLGSYNFSVAADRQNGENLVVIRDRRVAVSYMVEALSLFDHYHFRVVQQRAKQARKKLLLAKPPRKPGERAWWAEDYTDPRKVRDRELFA